MRDSLRPRAAQKIKAHRVHFYVSLTMNALEQPPMQLPRDERMEDAAASVVSAPAKQPPLPAPCAAVEINLDACESAIQSSRRQKKEKSAAAAAGKKGKAAGTAKERREAAEKQARAWTRKEAGEAVKDWCKFNADLVDITANLARSRRERKLKEQQILAWMSQNAVDTLTTHGKQELKRERHERRKPLNKKHVASAMKGFLNAPDDVAEKLAAAVFSSRQTHQVEKLTIVQPAKKGGAAAAAKE